MNDDKGAGEGHTERAYLFMENCSYGFYPTGCYAVDRILSEVVRSSNVFSCTSSWTDECDPYEGEVGGKPVDWIQNAANDCSTDFKSAYDAGRKAERERCLDIVLDGYPCTVDIAEIQKRIRGGSNEK